MADTKTSQLTQLAATPDVADLLMVVDVSDITMAATGTNKRLPASYLARSDAGPKLITGNGLELTVPATGTAAVRGTANTFTATQTMPYAQVTRGVGLPMIRKTVADNVSTQIAQLAWASGNGYIGIWLITATAGSGHNSGVAYLGFWRYNAFTLVSLGSSLSVPTNSLTVTASAEATGLYVTFSVTHDSSVGASAQVAFHLLPLNINIDVDYTLTAL